MKNWVVQLDRFLCSNKTNWPARHQSTYLWRCSPIWTRRLEWNLNSSFLSCLEKMPPHFLFQDIFLIFFHFIFCNKGFLLRVKKVGWTPFIEHFLSRGAKWFRYRVSIHHRVGFKDGTPTRRSTYIPGTLNTQFYMDVWWSNHFPSKGLETTTKICLFRVPGKYTFSVGYAQSKPWQCTIASWYLEDHPRTNVSG